MAGSQCRAVNQVRRRSKNGQLREGVEREGRDGAEIGGSGGGWGRVHSYGAKLDARKQGERSGGAAGAAAYTIQPILPGNQAIQSAGPHNLGKLVRGGQGGSAAQPACLWPAAPIA